MTEAAAYGPVPGPYWLQLPGTAARYYDYGELQQLALSQVIGPDTVVQGPSDPYPYPAKHVPGLYSAKEWTTALILSVLVGGFGADRFYLGEVGLGIAKLVTLGGCGVWTIIDIVLIATRKLNDADGRPLR